MGPHLAGVCPSPCHTVTFCRILFPPETGNPDLECLAAIPEAKRGIRLTQTGQVMAAAADAPGLRSQLIAAAGGSLVLHVSMKILALIASILLARTLGAKGYGVYASALALLLLLGIPAQLGLPTLVVRLLASYRVREEWGLSRGLLLRSGGSVFLLSALVAAFGASVVGLMGGRLSVEQGRTLWWAMVLLPVMALNDLRSAALRGLHHVVSGQLPDQLIAPGLFVVLLVVWKFVFPHSLPTLTPVVAMGLYFLSGLTAFGIGASILFRRIPSQIRHATARYDTFGWMRSALPLLLISGMGIINVRIGVVMVAAIRGTHSAGLYQAAASGAELVALSLVVMSLVMQPTISRMYARGEKQRLQRIITVAARTALGLALFSALFFALFATPILRLVYGREFEAAALSLMILCAAHVINTGTGTADQILNMTGHERDTAVAAVVGAVVNILLNALFIPLWDIEGAALATGLSLVVWKVLLILFVRRRLGLDPTAIGRRTV
jgi:O-antigen/teichoic acid export membrane protein